MSEKESDRGEPVTELTFYVLRLTIVDQKYPTMPRVPVLLPRAAMQVQVGGSPRLRSPLTSWRTESLGRKVREWLGVTPSFQIEKSAAAGA